MRKKPEYCVEESNYWKHCEYKNCEHCVYNHPPKESEQTEQKHKDCKQSHTPLPWRYHDPQPDICLELHPIGDEEYGSTVIADILLESVGAAEAMANTEFILLACNSHYKLVEELEVMVKHVEAVNYAFYCKGDRESLQAAMQGQKQLLESARAAIAATETE